MFCVVAVVAADCCCERGRGGRVNEGLSVIHKLKYKKSARANNEAPVKTKQKTMIIFSTE